MYSASFMNQRFGVTVFLCHISRLWDDRIETDPEYDKLAESYIKAINKKIEKYNYQYDTPIFTATKELKRIPNQSLNPLGQLITTGIKEEFNLQILDKSKKIDLHE